MAPADAFWSSRARVVYILEEELNGFLTVYFTWYFVVKILDFRDPWFCHSKTEVCGAWRLLKRAPRELQESPKGAYREPLGASWALLGSSWGLLGRSWGRLGSLRPFLGSKSAQNSTTRAQYNPKTLDIEKPWKTNGSLWFLGATAAARQRKRATRDIKRGPREPWTGLREP